MNRLGKQLVFWIILIWISMEGQDEEFSYGDIYEPFGNTMLSDIGCLRMKTYKKVESLPYQPHSISVKKIEELKNVTYPSKYFTVFIATDWTNIKEDEMYSIFKELIKSGMRYFCAWGNDCEKAHTQCDEANISFNTESNNDIFVMTTGHQDESLSKALWFFLFNAMVDDEYWNECTSIAISIDNKNYYQEIDSAFSNTKDFNDNVVNTDE